MKQYDSPLMIILSTVFCACGIGISFIYMNRFFAFYLACAIISSIALIACTVCLILRFTKYKGQERCQVLTTISVLTISVVLIIIVIGTVTIMFS